MSLFTQHAILSAKMRNVQLRLRDCVSDFDELYALLDTVRLEERQKVYNTFRCSPCGGNGRVPIAGSEESGICEMCDGTGIVGTIRTWSDFERRLG